jgi:hypothetical protein
MDPRTAWILANPPPGSHIVYPYTDDRSLVDAVGFYASTGLAGGDAVILITTEAHRYAIKKYLKADGNVEALEAGGQLSLLDATELMSVFMVDGDPDPKLFKTGMGRLIERARCDAATGCNRQVRLFGEMVSLLWPANMTATEHLEKLGNETIEEYSIPILCAYSLGGPGRGKLPKSLIASHSYAIT